MQRRFPVGWAIFAFAIVMLAIGYEVYFAHPSLNSSNPLDASRLNAVSQISTCPSDLRLRLTILYDKPPVYVEEYKMRDNNGISTSSYRIRGYGGKQITISSLPGEVFDVSFLFGSVVEDGIWQLMNRPPRGDTSAHYTLYVQQTAVVHVSDPNDSLGRTACRTGKRTITFTDPKYWATAAGHEYHLDLSKGLPKTATDLMKLQSSSTADPRFEKIVQEFRAFGPASFRSKVAAAQRSIRGKT